MTIFSSLTGLRGPDEAGQAISPPIYQGAARATGAPRCKAPEGASQTTAFPAKVSSVFAAVLTLVTLGFLWPSWLRASRPSAPVTRAQAARVSSKKGKRAASKRAKAAKAAALQAEWAANRAAKMAPAQCILAWMAPLLDLDIGSTSSDAPAAPVQLPTDDDTFFFAPDAPITIGRLLACPPLQGIAATVMFVFVLSFDTLLALLSVLSSSVVHASAALPASTLIWASVPLVFLVTFFISCLIFYAAEWAVCAVFRACKCCVIAVATAVARIPSFFAKPIKKETKAAPVPTSPVPVATVTTPTPISAPSATVATTVAAAPAALSPVKTKLKPKAHPAPAVKDSTPSSPITPTLESAPAPSSANRHESEEEQAAATVEPQPQPSPAVPHSKKKPAAAPMHTKCQESLLTTQFQPEGHNGLVTLVVVLIFFAASNALLEHIDAHGASLPSVSAMKASAGAVLAPWTAAPLLKCWALLACAYIFALATELVAARRLAAEPNGRVSATLTEIFATVAHLTTIAAVLIAPSAATFFVTDIQPVPGIALVACSVVAGMKLLSFAHVHNSLRRETRAARSGKQPAESIEGALAEYPANLTPTNVLYFVAAPTLCYQTSYPRGERVHWLRVAWHALAMGTCLVGIVSIWNSATVSTVVSSRDAVAARGWVQLRLVTLGLSLAIPNTLVWLLMFVAFFHQYLNLLGEVLRFGDREFYQAWWNATTVEDYWKLWNAPVHKWMLRHIYFPITNATNAKGLAMVIVFFLSAVLHELVVAMPLRTLSCTTLYAFAGMMAQVPLAWGTAWMKRRWGVEWVGDAVFWVTFCVLGQTNALILYANAVAF